MKSIGEIEIGAFEAKKLLDDYKEDFPEIVRWLRKRMASANGPTLQDKD